MQPKNEVEALVLRYFEEILNQGNYDVAGEIFASQYVHHEASQEDITSPLEPAIDARTGFPDIHFTIKDIVSNENTVVVRWWATGNHLGEYSKIPPTGKFVAVGGVSLFRVTEGKISESWMYEDGVGVLKQMGLVG